MFYHFTWNDKLCIHVYIFLYVLICFEYTHLPTCTHVCVYIYIDIYRDMYIYMYTYMFFLTFMDLYLRTSVHTLVNYVRDQLCSFYYFTLGSDGPVCD